jgi:hypothetical protein
MNLTTDPHLMLRLDLYLYTAIHLHGIVLNSAWVWMPPAIVSKEEAAKMFACRLSLMLFDNISVDHTRLLRIEDYFKKIVSSVLMFGIFPLPPPNPVGRLAEAETVPVLLGGGGGGLLPPCPLDFWEKIRKYTKH